MTRTAPVRTVSDDKWSKSEIETVTAPFAGNNMYADDVENVTVALD